METPLRYPIGIPPPPHHRDPAVIILQDQSFPALQQVRDGATVRVSQPKAQNAGLGGS